MDPLIVAPKRILVKDHGAAQINLGHPRFELLYPVAELIFTELHHNTNGAIGDTPSFALIFDKWDMICTTGIRAYAQVSLNKLDNALRELGYQITKL